MTHHCQTVNSLWASLVGYGTFDFGIVSVVLYLGRLAMRVKSSLEGGKRWAKYEVVTEEYRRKADGVFEMLVYMDLKFLGPARLEPGGYRWCF